MRGDIAPVRSVVERGAGAGNYIVELVEDEDAALRDDWEGENAPVHVRPGRVGLESAAEMHYPEITLRAFAEAPLDGGLIGELGTWPVVFRKGRVSVWSGDTYPGDEKPLKLVKSPGGRYLMRVAVKRKDVGDQDLDEYAADRTNRDGVEPHDLERFTVDFWPAP